jgi:hypothetical protein
MAFRFVSDASKPMKIDCPRAVRETYGKLLEVPLRDAVQNTLEHPGDEDMPTGERWKQ